MIKTWDERCAEHPDHQTGMVTERMIVRRMQEEIAELRAALAQPEPTTPVGWFESPHGAFRANPLYKLEFPSQLLAWSVPVYTAPPQRKPLTDEEILKAIGWDRAEMYMKLTPNFPVAEAKKETLKNARAIEAAHGIGGDE